MIYHWVLERPHRLSIYVTVDAPELPDMLHVMVSDPSSSAVDPVATIPLRTMEETESVVQRIMGQWNGKGV